MLRRKVPWRDGGGFLACWTLGRSGIGDRGTPNGHKAHTYAVERYANEVKRLHRVLDKRLQQSEFLAGPEYGIADIATFPWVRNPDRRGIGLAEYPAVARWHDAIAARPAVQRGVEVLAENQRRTPITDEEREMVFGKAQFAAR